MSSTTAPSGPVPTHGQLKSATSTMQMQYTTAAMQSPAYGLSPGQNNQQQQQQFQLTTNTLGSDGNQVLR